MVSERDRNHARRARLARQLCGHRSAVQPDVLPGDPAISELEDVQDTEPDLLAVPRNAEKLPSDGSGHQVFNDQRVVGVIGMETFFTVGADLFDQLPLKLQSRRDPLQRRTREANHVVLNVVGVGGDSALRVTVSLGAKVRLD
jgi:hypothetical protein